MIFHSLCSVEITKWVVPCLVDCTALPTAYRIAELKTALDLFLKYENRVFNRAPLP